MTGASESEPTYFAFAQPARKQAERRTTCLPPVPELLCNRYRVERLLGVGGMGAVFKGRDLLREQLGDPCPLVAIKTLNNECAEYPDAPTLLHSEFVHTLRLKHPNIIRVLHFDIDPASEHPFIVMELFEGLTLDQLLLRQPRRLAWSDVHSIGSGVLAAVVHCHDQGAVHGDIKPSNILAGKEDVRLFDFGLGRGSLDELPQLDRERFKAWTPKYAAPEILQGEPASHSTDVYSLGCVLLELSGGCLKKETELQRPEQMPTGIWKLLNRAISSEPKQRCSARQLYEAWEDTARPSYFARLVGRF
ncbi:MAG TPA: serine/threonine-protein kinase [Pseudomonas sp.]|jgi:serine/threonine-protein kinase Stk1|nr:serine/threonine-protein kinase [Pseudomonas sp.]